MTSDLKTERQKDVEVEVRRILAIGPAQVMRDEEIGAGYKIVMPGERPWLPSCDWPDNIVISTDERVVRIVAIYATHPGQGAFRRLIKGIQAAGLRPIVVEPMLDMPAILQRWGWKFRRVGYGWNSHVIAKPRAARFPNPGGT